MRLPLVTALVLAPALAAYASPALSAWLVYDRALVLSGEVWRLVTGPWVHFSAGHLAWDALAVGAAAALLERESRGRLAALCLAAALAGGGALLVAAPEVARAGGLSGLAAAVIVAAALRGLAGRPPGRAASAALLGLVAVKVALEAAGSGARLAADLPPGVAPLPLVHLAGAAAALGLAAWDARGRAAARGGGGGAAGPRSASRAPAPAWTACGVRPRGSVGSDPAALTALYVRVADGVVHRSSSPSGSSSSRTSSSVI